MRSNDSLNGVYSTLVLSQAEAYACIAFTAIAYVFSLELVVRIFAFFKRWRGLYFWSLVVSTVGVLLHATSNFLRITYVTEDAAVFLPICLVGWSAMVTGQSLVMWSRLGLLMRSRRTLRGLLGLIVVDGVVLHSMIIVISVVARSPSPHALTAAHIYSTIAEPIQLAIFTFQETLISLFYVLEIRKLLRRHALLSFPANTPPTRTRAVTRNLLTLNVLIVLLDACILALDFAGLFIVQSIFKSAVYAYKLRLEFEILNQLVGTITEGERAEGRWWGGRGRRRIGRGSDLDGGWWWSWEPWMGRGSSEEGSPSSGGQACRGIGEGGHEVPSIERLTTEEMRER